MANKDQIKALLDSYFSRDENRFVSVALQVAASAAKKGQNNLAREIKEIVDKGRHQQSLKEKNNVIQLKSMKSDLANLLTMSYPEESLKNAVFSENVDSKIRKALKEQKQRYRLREFSLEPTSKLLLTGLSGTGKTLTSKIIANDLKLPLYTIQFEGLLSRYMGESAAKLKLIFDHIKEHRGVYLFDEFDAIGSKRTSENDIGEIRRVLNSFLQLLEMKSDSIIVCATNHPELLDHALFRRFDIVIDYQNPSEEEIVTLLKSQLYAFVKSKLDWKLVASYAYGMNHAEIVRTCNDIAKEIVLNENFFISPESLRPFFK